MSQSRTLDLGMDVPKDSIAVADVAQAHSAEVLASDPSAPDKPTSSTSPARAKRRPHTSSLSMKPGPAATGSLSISRKRGLGAGWWHPHGFRTTRVIGCKPIAAMP